MADRTIAVIGGTGDQGFGLVLRWAKAGEKVVIGSRQQQKGEDAARKAREILGGNASVTGTENAKAAASASYCLLVGGFISLIFLRIVYTNIKMFIRTLGYV